MYYKGSVHNPIGDRGYLCGAFLRKDNSLYSKKFEVAYMKLNSGTKVKKHYHKEVDEFVIVVKGGLKEEVDGDLLDLKPGDFLFIKAGFLDN